MSDQNQDLNMQDLQAKIEEIKQSLKQVEDMESRQQGLMDTALADARAQADQIIAEANANAEAIRERARAEGRKAVQADRERAESERDTLKNEVAALQAKKQEMLEQLGGMREQLQQTLNETQPVPAPVPMPTPVQTPEIKPEPIPIPAQAPEEVKPEPTPAPAQAPEVKPEPIPAPAQAPKAVPAPVAQPAQKKTQPDTILVDAPGAKPKKKHRGLKIFLFILLFLALAAAVCFGFIFGIAKVNDEGMTEIAGKGDYVFYNRLEKDPDNGDVILIKDRKGSKRLRFVAATEGQQVDMDAMERRLYVDDEVAVEEYEPTADDTTKYPHTVGDNEVYVLCDNRDEASQEGLFSKNAIKGRVLLVFRR